MTFDDFISIAFVNMCFIYTINNIVLRGDISYLQHQIEEIKAQIKEE